MRTQEFRLIRIVETKNKTKDTHGNILLRDRYKHKFESEVDDSKLVIDTNKELPLAIGAVIELYLVVIPTKLGKEK